MKNSFFIKILSLLLIFTLNFSLVSCQKNYETENTNFITFKDDLNREVSVKKNPERVAALLGSFADVWILAGGSVCATAQDAWEDFDLELENALNIGGAHSPNTEILLSAKPDFVIASASTSSNVEMKELLENAGITVAYFDVDNFYDYLEMLDICTDITGRKDLYKTNGIKIKEKIDIIKSDFQKKSLSQQEKTVLLLRASSGFVKAKGSSGTVLGEMLKDLGCINIADSDSSILENLSIESIVKQNPYRIFVVTMGDDTDKAVENFNRLVNENQAFASLDAYENDRYHIMDRKLFNIKPNSKWAESYEKLCEVLCE